MRRETFTGEANGSTDMLHIHNNLYIALSDMDILHGLPELKDGKFMLIPFNCVRRYQHEMVNNLQEIELFQPCYLSAIYCFDEKVKNISSKKCERCKLVFCATSSDAKSRVKLAFLLGCHMIMTHGIGFEETHLSIRKIWNKFDDAKLLDFSVGNALRAFCSAKCLNWIEFSKHSKNPDETHQTIDMEEFDHYARWLLNLFMAYYSSLFSAPSQGPLRP